MQYLREVLVERAPSEGDQIKAAIRELFVTTREGAAHTREDPLRVHVTGVNGSAEKTLCLFRHPDLAGAVVLWYE